MIGHGQERCPPCNKVYADSYLNTHIRKIHHREPPKKKPKKVFAQQTMKGKPNTFVHRNPDGTLKKWTQKMPRGVRTDAGKKSKTKPRRNGFGYRGNTPNASEGSHTPISPLESDECSPS